MCVKSGHYAVIYIGDGIGLSGCQSFNVCYGQWAHYIDIYIGDDIWSDWMNVNHSMHVMFDELGFASKCRKKNVYEG